MKQLIAPGVVVVPSGFPRTRRRDSRGIRICFDSLARSCGDQTGFFNFTDGASYEYFPVSNGDAEVLCASGIRGRFFNGSIRRSNGDYLRGYTPPGDYEIIYQYPPYFGVAPAACGVPGVNWNLLSWSPITAATFDAAGVFAGSHFSLSGSWAGPFLGQNATWAWEGTMSYTGGPVSASFNFTGIPAPTGKTQMQVLVVITQDGVDLLNDGFGPGQAQAINFSGGLPFSVADTLGVASVLDVQISWNLNPFVQSNLAHQSLAATGFLA